LKGSASAKQYLKIQSMAQKKNTLRFSYKDKAIDAIWRIIVSYSEYRTKGIIHGAEKMQIFKP